MGRYTARYKAVLAATAFLLPSLASAQEQIQPLVLKAKYTVAWNGITIGRIRLSANETATSYTLSVDTKTHGIGTLFSNEKRVASASGKRTSNGRYIASRYESIPMDAGKGTKTLVTYDAGGAIATQQKTPPEDPNWRPPVPLADANTAQDPVSAGLVLRHQLYTKRPNEVQIKTYDGSRLAAMKFTVIKPEARVQVMNSYVPAVNILITRQLLAGYTTKEIKRYNAGDPEIHLYFSADEKFIPLLATVETSFGQLSATLSEKE